MSFDLDEMTKLVAQHGKVTRIVVAGVEGSAPREVGASVCLWDGGQSGTIGGGALEFQAVIDARRGDYFKRIPLGPAIGQCCGGAVRLLCETFDRERLAEISDDFFLRQIEGMAETPLAIRRDARSIRNGAETIAPRLQAGWFIEPITTSKRDLWIYGAGHVGRALVGILSPLPALSITWVDTGNDRFPTTIASNITKIVAVSPADIVRHAPTRAEHLVLTYSHAFDLQICHAILSHGFGWAGLIGSQTKWARFRTRLAALGHAKDQIERIQCPIGQKSLGKHPQALALGVAVEFLERNQALQAPHAKTG